MPTMTAKAFSSRACPISAEIVLALREAFGEDCRVLYVREGGVERGDPQAIATPPTPKVDAHRLTAT